MSFVREYNPKYDKNSLANNEEGYDEFVWMCNEQLLDLAAMKHPVNWDEAQQRDDAIAELELRRGRLI